MKILGFLCFVLALSAFAPAVETPPADPPADSPARARSPMMTEITAAFAAARQEVAALKLQYDAAATTAEAMALARRIVAVKQDNRVEVMRIQLRYAHTEGRAETAAELEEIITRMTTPPAPGVPVQRRPNHQ